jgi:DNA-binding winged helix-turn-helix (wHTH) protein
LQTRQIYRFGPFTLDATAKVLLRDGEPVRLARKAVETLLALVEQPGRVLTKDELIEVIWQGRVVDEANLIQNIAVVRRTLGLKPGAAGYIETFPGRGYRLLGPIGVEQEEPHRPQPGSTVQTPTTLATAEPSVQTAIVAAPAGKTTSRARLIIASAALAAIAVAAVIWIFLLRDHRSAETRFQRTAVARLGGKEYQPAVSARRPERRVCAGAWRRISQPHLDAQRFVGARDHRQSGMGIQQPGLVSGREVAGISQDERKPRRTGDRLPIGKTRACCRDGVPDALRSSEPSSRLVA